MDLRTVYTKSAKGVLEIRSRISRLPRDLAQALRLVDGKSSVAELAKPSGIDAEMLAASLEKLFKEGYLEKLSEPAPGLSPSPGRSAAVTSLDSLDFTSLLRSRGQDGAQAEEDRRIREEAERRGREEALRRAREKAEEEMREEMEKIAAAAASVNAEEDESTWGRRNRTFIASVLFLDIVEYSARPVAAQIEIKKQFTDLVSRLIKDIPEADRVVLDTGDGAAVSFLGDPEDALTVAIKLQEALRKNQHKDYKNLYVRMGINLGPVRIVRDVNERINLVGDAINDAQRVMSFAEPDQILVSRSFYDVIARLSQDYGRMFRYQGVRKDKHLREHQIYELLSPASAGKPGAAAPEAQAEVLFEELDLSRLEEIAASSPVPAAASASEREKAEAEAEARRREAQAQAQREAEEKAQTEARARAKAQAEARARQEALLKLQAEADREVWERAQKQSASAPREEGRPQAPAPAHAPIKAPAPARKPAAWIKPAAYFLLALAVLALVLLHVIPLDFVAPRLAAAASERLHDTVVIRSVRFSLFPTPRLKLEGVAVGKDASAAEVVVPAWPLVTGGRVLDAIEIRGAVLGEKALSRLPLWSEGKGPFQVRNAIFKEAKLDFPGFKLPPFDGEVVLGPEGRFQKATLAASDGKLSGEAVLEDRTLEIRAAAKSWQMPLGPALSFDSVQVKAQATRDELRVMECEAWLYGGVVSAQGRLSWGNPWRLEGKLSAKNLDLQPLLAALASSPAISGTLRGQADFATAGAPGLKTLFDSPWLAGSFVVEKGALHNVDLAQALRSSGPGWHGGETRFERLSGTLAVASHRYAFRQLVMQAGLLTASGAVDLGPSQALSGRIQVEIQSPRNPLRGALTVSGSLSEPLLKP